MTSVVKIKTKPIFAARRVKKRICEERLHAQAVKRMYDRQSGEQVGWLYEWNTGDLEPMWCSGPKLNVRYEDIPPEEMPNG